MQKQRRPLSRRTTLTLSVLVVGALASLAWTSNTAWWPWSSEASSPTFTKDTSNVNQAPSQDSLKDTTKGTTTTSTPDLTKDPSKANQAPSGAGLGDTLKGTGTEAQPASSGASACTSSGDGFVDPCATFGENLQKIYKESISLMMLLAFLVLIYAGYRYITSLGNPEATKDAKEWAVGAVSGIALLLLIPLIMQALGVTSSTSGTSPSGTTPGWVPSGTDTNPGTGTQTPAAPGPESDTPVPTDLEQTPA